MARLNCECGQELTGIALPQVCISCGKVMHDKAKEWRTSSAQNPFDHKEFAGIDLSQYVPAVPAPDPINPIHYCSHPSGIEVIQITEHMGFCLGNAVKYILRCDLKGNAIEDLEKSIWYIKREIERRKGRVNEAKP